MALVTDRTADDVQRWKILRDKGWVNMTDAERDEWLGKTSPTPSARKGMYTYEDMNRVEDEVYVLYRLALSYGVGSSFPQMSFKDWSQGNAVTREDMERYLFNIEALRSAIGVYSSTPSTPSIDAPFTYVCANNIELILQDIRAIIVARGGV